MSRKGPELIVLHPEPEPLPPFRKRRSSEQLPKSTGKCWEVRGGGKQSRCCLEGDEDMLFPENRTQTGAACLQRVFSFLLNPGEYFSLVPIKTVAMN